MYSNTSSHKRGKIVGPAHILLERYFQFKRTEVYEIKNGSALDFQEER